MFASNLVWWWHRCLVQLCGKVSEQWVTLKKDRLRKVTVLSFQIPALAFWIVLPRQKKRFSSALFLFRSWLWKKCISQWGRLYSSYYYSSIVSFLVSSKNMIIFSIWLIYRRVFLNWVIILSSTCLTIVVKNGDHNNKTTKSVDNDMKTSVKIQWWREWVSCINKNSKKNYGVFLAKRVCWGSFFEKLKLFVILAV